MKVGNHHEYELDSINCVLYNYKIIKPNDAQLQNKANRCPNSQQLKPKLNIISQYRYYSRYTLIKLHSQ